MATLQDVNKRKKFIWLILILLLLLIIAIVIYLLLPRYMPPVPVQTNVNVNINQPVTPAAPTSPQAFNTANTGVLADLLAQAGSQPNAEEQRTLLFTASAFAERFGSYSNQSGYKNLDELDVFMTASMKKYALDTLKTQLEKQNSNLDVYYAIEAKAISTQVNNLNENTGTAEVLVKTQRQEFKNDITNPRIFYQDILLKIVKENNQWKVNGAFWQ